MCSAFRLVLDLLAYLRRELFWELKENYSVQLEWEKKFWTFPKVVSDFHIKEKSPVQYISMTFLNLKVSEIFPCSKIIFFSLFELLYRGLSECEDSVLAVISTICC